MPRPTARLEPMNITRRDLMFGSLAIAAGVAPSLDPGPAFATEDRPAMYGMIGKMTARPGLRDALAAVLLDGTREMPGCLAYLVAADAADPDALWITEAWRSKEDHEASLRIPAVQAAIAKGRPMIAGFGERVVTTPLGGIGLAT